MNRNLFPNQEGAIAIITLMAVSVFALIVMTTLTALATTNMQMTSAQAATEKTFYAAEAGINEALYRLIEHPIPPPFTLDVNGIDVEVNIQASGHQRTITSRATDSTGKVRTLQLAATSSAFAGGFDYAVQSGTGGIEILNNSTVIGDVYSNGNIFGGTGSAIQAFVNGNLWVAGGPAVGPGPSQESGSTSHNVGDQLSNMNAAQSLRVNADTQLKKVELFISRVGNLTSNPILKIVNDAAGSPSTNVIASKSIDKQNIPQAPNPWTPVPAMPVEFDIGPMLFTNTTYWLVLDLSGTTSSKYIIWQFDTDTDSYIDGEAKESSDFSSGTWNPLNGDFNFKTFVGTDDTFIRQLEVSGDTHAHTINKSAINGDAFYFDSSTFINSTVNPPGTQIFPQPDPPSKPFPITDSDIEQWKTEIESAGSPFTDTYTVSGTVELESKKITGDLIFENNSHLIMSGNIWVQGNIITNQGSKISLHPDVGQASGVLIADGKIHINEGTDIEGSGDPKSFVLIISTNNSIVPLDPAILIDNNASAAIFYAKNGMVNLLNSDLKCASGYFVRLDEGSTITFDRNLIGFFVPSSGSDEEIDPIPDTWQEL
jgi:hypothetical protein